ncbi:cytochrome P450 [Russula earlei]|uniref:Cytochrome P450 n=1 Tax=Russula earlei TaxID=71964 RepID=A0ACC0UD50_9AGAM|nr:cytochrome P450 [Russula earlei]
MPPGPDWLVLASAVLSIFVVSRVLKFIAGIKSRGSRAHEYHFLPSAFLALPFPTSWWNPGVAWVWKWRRSFYKQWRSEVVSFVPFLRGPPFIYTCSLEVARQFLSGGFQSVWVKPKWSVETLLEWGPNLVSVNKEVWRRHRRIVGPAFNPTTYSLVWAETLRVYRDIITTEGWTQKDVVILDPVQTYTTRLAFLVISACGFGLSFPWKDETKSDNGGMGIHEAMRIWASTVTLRAITPSWAYRLPFKLFRDITISTQMLRDSLGKMILERRAEMNSETTASNVEKKDIFTLLVRASEEDSKLQLSDSELVSENITTLGNVFALMFAGHETTASTIAATIGLLGLYSEIQEDIYKKIIKAVGHDRDPTFEDFHQLEAVAHAFYEALRLFPAGYIMIREATEDTTISIPNADGQPGMRQIPIPKDLPMVVDVVGIQYNPRYFPDPEKYDPSRWRGVMAESEDITAFSIGPRTCPGRKFAVVEAVCFLTLIVRDWIIEPIMNPGETGEEWRERVMQTHTAVTLTVKHFPVRLRRRARAAPPV